MLGKSKRWKRTNRCVAHSERLEDRCLLSGDGLVTPAAASPAEPAFVGFADQVEWQTFLVETAVTRYQSLFDQPGGWWYPWYRGGGPEFLDFATAGAPGEVDSSQTNVQVQGIDEGDIVETDGRFLYVLSDNVLSVIDVSQPNAPAVTWNHTWDPAEHADSLYLYDNRLTVISSSMQYWIEPLATTDVAMIEPAVDGISIAPEWEPSKPEVIASVYDVGNAGTPQLLYETSFDGWLVSSRSVDGQLFLVLQENFELPMPRRVPSENPNPQTTLPPASSETDLAYRPYPGWDDGTLYESEASYRAWLAEELVVRPDLGTIPTYSTVDATGAILAEGALTDSNRLLRETGQSADQFLTVVTLDTQANSGLPTDSATVLTTYGGQVYMAHDALYLFRGEWTGDGNSTRIVKFDVDTATGHVAPAATGNVPGNMLNRFSADHYNGFLRVATTDGWGATATNHVYVMGQQESRLGVVGQVEIMRGETIFSARFLGDEAYIVTFLRTDPLFRVDLSNPTDPHVVGALKIPGFSDYLQFAAPGYLLGLGRDADPQTGRPGALQVSLFDVRNDEPSLVDGYHFPGGTQTWTDATWDPHAFGWYPGYNVLALPVNQYWYEPWRDDLWTNGWARQSFVLHVMHIDPATGVEALGTVRHPSPVLRSLRINDNLFSLSSHTLKVTKISHPQQLLATLAFRPDGPQLPEDRQDTIADEIGPNAALLSIRDQPATFLNSALEHAGDVDAIRVDLPQRGMLTVNAKFEGTSPLRVQLVDRSGNAITERLFPNSDSLSLNLEVLGHDFVYLLVSANDGATTGAYSLALQWTVKDDPTVDDHADTIGPQATKIDLASGDVIEGRLQSEQDRDVFQLGVPSNGILLMDAPQLADGILRVEVVTANGEAIPTRTPLENPDGTDIHPEREYMVRADQQLYVVVSGSRADAALIDYTIHVHFAPDDPPPPTRRGDMNDDGTIDAVDAGALFGNWGRTPLETAAAAQDAAQWGDLNGDGYVDAADAAILFAQWTGDAIATEVATPETGPQPTTQNMANSMELATVAASAPRDWPNQVDRLFGSRRSRSRE